MATTGKQRWYFVAELPDGRRGGEVTASSYTQAMARVRRFYTDATAIEVMAMPIKEGTNADA